jgi:hypothetical protein
MQCENFVFNGSDFVCRDNPAECQLKSAFLFNYDNKDKIIKKYKEKKING